MRNPAEDQDPLRRRAETRLGDDGPRLGDLPPEEIRAVLHDLQVHQVELEIQNEEHRNVQSMLEASRDAYARLFDEAPVGYLIVDSSGRVVQSNSTLAAMLGRQSCDINQRPLVALVAEDDRRILLSRFAALGRKPGGKSVVLRLLTATGGEFFALLDLKSDWRDGGFSAEGRGDPLLLVTVSDVTDEVRSQRETSEMKARLELRARIQGCFLGADEDDLYAEVLEVVKDVLDSPLGYFGYIDSRGDLSCASMTREIFAACQIPGKSITFPRSSWGGLWGRSLVDKRTMLANGGLETPDGHLRLHAALAVPLLYGGDLIGQIVVANRQGGYTRVHAGVLEEMAAIVVPVLYRQRRAREAEEQLRQAQKMESVGKLAGGVAHDFNNLLTGIVGNLDLASLDLVPDHPAQQSLDEVRKCVDLASDVVQRLLTYSRKQLIRPQVVDLRSVVGGLAQMLQRLIGEDVEMLLELPAEACWVNMDPNQLEQVIVNLAVNGRDAMPGGGRLDIAVRPGSAAEALPVRRASATAAPCWDLCVADSGHGIPVEIREHIFEPFFTTKGPGVGTGLGLAMVQGAVHQNGGVVVVDSDPDHGTSFHVLLPVVAGPDTPLVRVAPDGGPLAEGAGVVLVAEDEPSLRVLCRRILERAGYEVKTARDGAEALGIVNAPGPPIDLLISDVVMPKIDGAELARQARARFPGLKVLFMSGYAEDVIAHRGVLELDVHFLRKPYRPTALVEAVARILDGNEG